MEQRRSTIRLLRRLSDPIHIAYRRIIPTGWRLVRSNTHWAGPQSAEPDRAHREEGIAPRPATGSTACGNCVSLSSADSIASSTCTLPAPHREDQMAMAVRRSYQRRSVRRRGSEDLRPRRGLSTFLVRFGHYTCALACCGVFIDEEAFGPAGDYPFRAENAKRHSYESPTSARCMAPSREPRTSLPPSCRRPEPPTLSSPRSASRRLSTPCTSETEEGRSGPDSLREGPAG